MKKRYRRIAVISAILITVFTAVYIRLKPIREYKYFPPYKGATGFRWNYPAFDSAKKTILIMADNDMTELFDLLTPFYLFSETGKANVYIVSQRKFPIVTENGPFILPHFSYQEADSLKVNPDVIVIPYMHASGSAEKISWIQKHFNDSVIVLSICDGAWTAAASGIYDNRPLTSHATGHSKLRKKFPGPRWIQNTRVAQSGNLYSTAGVSNATDGSLKVIERLFGRAIMLEILKKINYPAEDIVLEHVSNALTGKAKLSVLKKVLFKKNRRIGIWMQNGMNEMDLAALFDINARTMPLSIAGFIAQGDSITTKNGLTVISTDKINPGKIDELHVLTRSDTSLKQMNRFKKASIIYYDDNRGNYIVDAVLEGVKKDYGKAFSDFVRLTLDYN